MRMVFTAAILSTFCLAACSTPSNSSQANATDTPQAAAPAKAAKRDYNNTTGSRFSANQGGGTGGNAVNTYDSITPSGSVNKGNAAGVTTVSPQSPAPAQPQ